ncbi:hypothetical protein SMC26_14930 [Actinomadura fulvescens]|uniref:Guanylate cyclase domain-containing protein n=1 Tax=Actinomadura fulvescens TaxID=46160 RepID=A0ABN3QS95_9ACTN
MDNLPLHRSILAVDMERSTSPLRTNPIKGELRGHVYRMLDQALAHTGIGPRRRDPFEDRGDGVLALIHPDDGVPKTYLLSRLIPELARQLVDYNLSLPPDERPRRGLRLRAVVHAGEIHRDTYGYFGEALDVACRLLDARPLKKCLEAVPAPLALVVSEEIYQTIVKHAYDGISPETYQPDVRVKVAGRRRQGWVHVPTEALHLVTEDPHTFPDLDHTAA